MNTEQARDMAQVGKALSEPIRVLIVASLTKGPRPVKALSDGLSVTQPAMSYHLSLLRMAGVVQRVRKGKEIHYSLDLKKLAIVRRFLAGLK